MADDDPRVAAWIADINASTGACELRDHAEALAEAVRIIRAPPPSLPLDPVARERVLATAVVTYRDAARRLLSLVA
ncbi:hypothetical protein JQ625_28255 [Bradyrhizobium diazoefficiens]|nr:hypothetical protein [Bradyrhizobium diazoefficiens]MBR0778738.1 hypothetical protein [Bradyrhizobium diazoefficiens]